MEKKRTPAEDTAYTKAARDKWQQVVDCGVTPGGTQATTGQVETARHWVSVCDAWLAELAKQ